MCYSLIKWPTSVGISILLEKMDKMKHEMVLHHCNPRVDAIINGVKKRFGYIFRDVRLLTASEAHPMFRLMYIPGEKKADVVASLKAEVKLSNTISR